uniref:EF-hand domain-containing protein n=1 Tax=Globodera pallida TaxID=36090 RepID=A0A183BPF5_GLOPA
MPSGNAIVNSSACFQPVAQLSILNICPSAPVLSDELLRRKAAKEAEKCEDPLECVRLRCLAAGMATGKKLVRLFYSTKKETMDPDEFVQTLCTFSPISVSESEGRQIFDKLSVKHGNPVVVTKMVEELMPPLKAQRRALVEEVFRKMGSPKDTVSSVPLSALCALFNHRRQPEFESGTKSRDELLASFLATFEPDPDGQVLNIEFVAFYAAKSVAVPTDLHFDWMLRNQWKI